MSGKGNNRGGHEKGDRNPRTDENRQQMERDRDVSRDPDIGGVNKKRGEK